MKRDERGSLIIAMAVIMVLTGLAIAVLARTVSALTSARTSQDSSAALAAADAGLADARYQLDQPATPPTSVQTGTVTAAASYKWRATQIDTNTYQLTSTGTVNGRSRTVTETMSRPPRYPFALFGRDGVNFNGQSAAAGAIYAEKNGTFDPARKAGIGSNRAIVIGSRTGGGDSQTYYTPDGSCGGCPKPVGVAGPYDVVTPVAPASALPCPGSPPGLVDGTETFQTISAGTYLCTGDLTLRGDVRINASASSPAVIYMTDGTLHLGGLTMSGTSDPSALQILKTGPGRIDPGGASNPAHFSGIIDAPNAMLSSSSCSMFTLGALVLDVFSCGGATPPNFSLAYDDRVQALLSDAWQASAYQEIPTPASL